MIENKANNNYWRLGVVSWNRRVCAVSDNIIYSLAQSYCQDEMFEKPFMLSRCP